MMIRCGRQRRRFRRITFRPHARQIDRQGSLVTVNATWNSTVYRRLLQQASSMHMRTRRQISRLARVVSSRAISLSLSPRMIELSDRPTAVAMNVTSSFY
jgi:hypothetical protein